MLVFLLYIVVPSILLASVPVTLALPTAPLTEQHRVTLVNNCPFGTPRFLYQADGSPQGSTTIYGPLRGGVAWVEGYNDCTTNGLNCGTVEFTLIGSQSGDDKNTHNSVNYSLLKSKALGNHIHQYTMDFQMSGECAAGPGGPCISETVCPAAYVGTDTNSGKPVTCLGNNVDITITFC